jgi:hypothetical protein
MDWDLGVVDGGVWVVVEKVWSLQMLRASSTLEMTTDERDWRCRRSCRC